MDSQGDGSRDLIQSLERGMLVLREFARAGQPRSVSEIAAAVDLSRPAVRRILLTFEHLGYARQKRGVWSLTPRVLELSAGYYLRNSLPDIARPFLEGLVERLQETCAVTVLDGTDVVHVAIVEFRGVQPEPVRPGAPIPTHASAFGKVLLSGLRLAELETYLEQAPFTAYTEHTLVEADQLRDAVSQARRERFYIAVEELFPGVLALAVPIVVDNEMIGALGTTSTLFRSDLDKMRHETLPVLVATAAEIATAYHAGNRYLSGPPTQLPHGDLGYSSWLRAGQRVPD